MCVCVCLCVITLQICSVTSTVNYSVIFLFFPSIQAMPKRKERRHPERELHSLQKHKTTEMQIIFVVALALPIICNSSKSSSSLFMSINFGLNVAVLSTAKFTWRAYLDIARWRVTQSYTCHGRKLLDSWYITCPRLSWRYYHEEAQYTGKRGCLFVTQYSGSECGEGVGVGVD